MRLGVGTELSPLHIAWGGVMGAVLSLALSRFRPLRIADTRRRLGQRPGRPEVAVVCGGSRGLGRAIAHALARRGCAVAICARTPEDVERTRMELERMGVRAYGEACDLRDESQVKSFLSNVEQELGPIEILVANAATISVAPIETRDARDFEEALDSTFRTTLHPVLDVLPGMRERGHGTLVFITSIGAKIGVPHLAPYSAAKFAAAGLSEALRAEVHKDGIHVLTVYPGLMRTGSHTRASFKGDAAREYAWFASGAMAPLLSIDADRAAELIVRAIERKKTQITFTLPARIVSRTHDTFPGMFGTAFAVANKLLPRAPAHVFSRGEGRAVQSRSPSRLGNIMRRRSDRLAARHAQSS